MRATKTQLDHHDGKPVVTTHSANAPRAFMSYSWDGDEHRRWVHDLAVRLRGVGVDVTLDHWHAIPGDQLPAFMERAIRDNDYVLIVCTPKYKSKSDERLGGVGYEGDVMAAEVMAAKTPARSLADRSKVDRKFIPLLRAGKWEESGPSWLLGKYYIDLRGDPFSEEHFKDLWTTLHGRRATPPPVGPNPFASDSQSAQATAPVPPASPGLADPDGGPIRILGIVADEVTTPRNDGTRGSALYAVPFRLSRTPSYEWSELFVRTWDRPPEFSTMHRSGIAKVSGDKIILDGTTLEEVERVHRETLKVVLKAVNSEYEEMVQAAKRRQEQEQQRLKQHKDSVRGIANRLRFEDD
jgi:hypothetical protein